MSDGDRGPQPAPAEADDGVHLSESGAVASTEPTGGQAGSASGGYGSGSAVQSSAGSGEGAEDGVTSGADEETDWVREAPGGARER